MGQVTLQEFRLRLQAALGNANYDAALLDLWINAGVQEIAGAVYFDALEERVDVNLVAGQYRYVMGTDLPTDIIRPVSVGTLLKSGRTRVDKLSRVTPATPSLWIWDEQDLVVWATPAANATISMLYIKHHPQLVADTDVTILAPTWDNAVHYFATSAAMQDLGDDERAAFWHDKAVKYAGSRMSEAETGVEGWSEPIRVVTKGEILYREQPR